VTADVLPHEEGRAKLTVRQLDLIDSPPPNPVQRLEFTQDKPEKSVPEPPKQQLRIVTYFGDWVCKCGRQGKLWDNPCSCGLAGPCRDWVRGRCSYGDQCRCPPLPTNLFSSLLPAVVFVCQGGISIEEVS